MVWNTETINVEILKKSLENMRKVSMRKQIRKNFMTSG